MTTLSRSAILCDKSIGREEVSSMSFPVSQIHAPALVLYACLFVVLLPTGLIPPDIHSLLNRSLAVLALAAWAVGEIPRRRQYWSTTAWLMLCFLLWTGATLFWASDLYAGATTLSTYTLRFLVFFLLIPNLIRSREELNRLMYTLALSGWVLLLISLGYILLTGFEPGTRFQLFRENANEYGISALLMMCGVLWLAMQPSSRQSRRKLAAAIFLLMTIGLVGVSGSRGSAISLVVALVGFCFWGATRKWGKLGLSVLILAIVAAPMIFKATFDRFATTIGAPTNRAKETALGGRETLWQAGFQLIAQHPLAGVGVGNSGYDVKVFVEKLRKIEKGSGETSQGSQIALHNPIIVVWSETGLPGILLYLGVVVSAIWLFARQYFRHRRLGVKYLLPYFAVVTSVFLGYMISWIKGGGMQSHNTFFLMLSLLVIPSNLPLQKDSTVKTQLRDPK